MEISRQTLFQLSGAHRLLLERVRRAECRCLDATLSLGVAVRLYRTLVELLPEPARAVLDEGVVGQIRENGERLAENLEHLESLGATEPGSPEIEPLAAALLEGMRRHLEWNDRAVFRPLSRFYLEDSLRAPRSATDA